MSAYVRIEIRTTPEVMDQIRQAAAAEGRSVSGFVRHAGLQRAYEVLGTVEAAVQKTKVVDTSPPAAKQSAVDVLLAERGLEPLKQAGMKPVGITSWLGKIVDLYKDEGGHYRIENGRKIYHSDEEEETEED